MNEAKVIEKSSPKRQTFLACLQSTGRGGKSTWAEAFLHWLRFAGVEYTAIDADAEHRTLSSRDKNILFFDAVANRDQFAGLFKSLPTSPVLLADFPAQATSFLLENWQTFRINEVFSGQGCRLVNLIFMADDQTAMVSAAKIFKQFGTGSDYVLIKNPARFRSTEFEKTTLCHSLRDGGAREMSLPPLTAATLAAVQQLAKSTGAYVTLEQASASSAVEMLCRFELQHFLNVCMTQMEDLADVLLPSPALIKNKVTREAGNGKTEVNPFDL